MIIWLVAFSYPLCILSRAKRRTRLRKWRNHDEAAGCDLKSRGVHTRERRTRLGIYITRGIIRRGWFINRVNRDLARSKNGNRELAFASKGWQVKGGRKNEKKKKGWKNEEREGARAHTQQKPLSDKSVAQRRASKREKAGPNGGFAASQTVICLLQRLPRFRVPSASQVSAFTLPRVIKIGSEAIGPRVHARILGSRSRHVLLTHAETSAKLTLQFFPILLCFLSFFVSCLSSLSYVFTAFIFVL